MAKTIHLRREVYRYLGGSHEKLSALMPSVAAKYIDVTSGYSAYETEVPVPAELQSYPDMAMKLRDALGIEVMQQLSARAAKLKTENERLKLLLSEARNTIRPQENLPVTIQPATRSSICPECGEPIEVADLIGTLTWRGGKTEYVHVHCAEKYAREIGKVVEPRTRRS